MKRNEKLLLTLSEVSDEYIPSIEPSVKRHPLRRTAIGGGLLIAAMAALVLLSYITTGSNKLPVISPYVTFGEMGYEGYMAYDISEITTGNPWNPDIELTSLPVYKNLSYVDPIGREGFLTYLTEEQLAAMAEETADALGVEIVSTTVQTVQRARGSKKGISDELAQSPFLFKAICDGTPLGVQKITISIYGTGRIGIFFSEKLPLPDEYENADEASVIQYIIQRFPNLFDFENPIIYSYSSRNIYGELTTGFSVYDGSEDYTESIINYSLRSYIISPSVIHIGTPLSAAEYLGDYPIISPEEAQELLLDGKYISTVFEDMLKGGELSAEDVKKVDLIYITGFVEYYQPYYRFYVEMEDLNGMNNYGIFYVPAVCGEFLIDFSLWDGTINM